MWAKHKQHGFTIVELLIVIVVIGILAAISIVAYSGIQNRAVVAALTSDLDNASKKLKLYQVDNSAYPTNIDCSGSPAANSICLKSSNGTTYTTFTPANTTNPQTFCITATNGTTNYFINQDGTPTSGGCAITNLMTNPSFETSTGGWGSNITTLTRMSAGAVQGSAYLQAVRTATGDAYFYQSLSPNAPLSTTYTLSFWIWADSPTTLSSDLYLRHATTSGFYNLATISALQVSATPTRIVMTGTTNASSSTSGLQFIGRLPISIGTPIYVDGFMLTQGPTAYNYADGNSANWIWNGAVNNSTSTGSPL